MATYNLASQKSKLESIKSELQTLGKSISELRNVDVALAVSCQDLICAELEDTMSIMQRTWSGLQALPAPSLDNLGDEDTGNAALMPLAQNVSELSTNVDELVRLAKCGLDRASKVKQRTSQLSSKARSLDLEIETIREQVDAALDGATNSINDAIDSYDAKVEEYNEALQELDEVEEKLESKKSGRKAMRFARAVVWTTAVALPGVAVVGAAMEYGAHKLGNKIDDLKAKKWRHESEMENAEKQIESLEQQITKLESMAESVQELDDLCARNKTRANKDLDRAQKMAKELRDTDEIASNMSMTLRSLQEHTTFMKDFDVDREILQMAIKDFVKGLALGKQRDVLEVCQPMMKLLA